eukprot:IDg23800t1
MTSAFIGYPLNWGYLGEPARQYLQESQRQYQGDALRSDAGCREAWLFDRFRSLGRFVLAYDRMRYRTRGDFCRIRPEGYPEGRLNPGEHLGHRQYFTGYHCDRAFPSVRERSWWTHYINLSFDYTERHPDPARVAPMMVDLPDKSYVLIPGSLLPNRSDEEPNELVQEGGFNWRSYYPGFPGDHPGIVAGWYRRLSDADEAGVSLETVDVKARKLGDLHPGFRPMRPLQTRQRKLSGNSRTEKRGEDTRSSPARNYQLAPKLLLALIGSSQVLPK